MRKGNDAAVVAENKRKHTAVEMTSLTLKSSSKGASIIIAGCSPVLCVPQTALADVLSDKGPVRLILLKTGAHEQADVGMAQSREHGRLGPELLEFLF